MDEAVEWVVRNLSGMSWIDSRPVRSEHTRYGAHERQVFNMNEPFCSSSTYKISPLSSAPCAEGRRTRFDHLTLLGCTKNNVSKTSLSSK